MNTQTISKSLTTPEEDFVHELNAFLEYPLSDFGKRKVINMLNDYRIKNPFMRITKDESCQTIFYKKIYVPDPLQQKGEVSLKLTFDIISKIISDYFEIHIKKIYSKKRSRNYSIARKYISYFTYNLTNSTYENIGIKMGGRDHSTIIIQIKKIKEIISVDEQARKDFENISKLIKNAS